MEKRTWVIIVAIILFFLTLYFFTDLFKFCPRNCDDSNECTNDHCSKQTGFECAHSPVPSCCGNSICEEGENESICIGDCPGCDDSNECTEDIYSYSAKRCLAKPIIPCCGNTACEARETYANCKEDCPLDGEIEIKTSHISNPSIYKDTGQRVFYSIRNCLSSEIKLVELRWYYNSKQGKKITKEMLEQSKDPADANIKTISPNSCYTPATSLLITTIEKNQSDIFMSKIYFKFEYKNKIYEILSNEKLAKVGSNQYFDDKNLAIFNITNNNIQIAD